MIATICICHHCPGTITRDRAKVTSAFVNLQQLFGKGTEAGLGKYIKPKFSVGSTFYGAQFSLTLIIEIINLE